jgi:hypothetical protein
MRRAVHASLVTALCLALAASPAPAGADDAPSRKQAAATVDRLYGEAARAVRSYETVPAWTRCPGWPSTGCPCTIHDGASSAAWRSA